jgi:hypothetical protein
MRIAISGAASALALASPAVAADLPVTPYSAFQAMSGKFTRTSTGRCRLSLSSSRWPIVLKNSKIAGLRKSRKCSALAISAAARLFRIDTRASDSSCRN